MNIAKRIRKIERAKVRGIIDAKTARLEAIDQVKRAMPRATLQTCKTVAMRHGLRPFAV